MSECRNPVPKKDGIFGKWRYQMDIKVTHAGSEQFLVVSGFPFVVKGGVVHKITNINVLCENKSIHHPKDFALESVLRPGSGEWYKISVINDGIHKIDYDFLSSIGVNVESLNPNHIHIANGDGMPGIEVACYQELMTLLKMPFSMRK